MLRKSCLLSVTIVTVLVLATGLAFADSGLTAADAVVATGVENLTPMGAADSFASDVGTLYAFSRINGAEGDVTIKHKWYHGDDLMADIALNVKSASWRTYSSKEIMPEWTGDWKVVMEAEDGTEITTLTFTIK